MKCSFSNVKRETAGRAKKKLVPFRAVLNKGEERKEEREEKEK
jgi:hypothetical protein